MIGLLFPLHILLIVTVFAYRLSGLGDWLHTICTYQQMVTHIIGLIFYTLH